MKNLIFVLCMSLLSLTGSAQMVTLMGSHTTFDTLDDAGTVYLTTPTGALNNMTAGKYAIQMSIANVSGTTGGTCILEGTIDGTNWVVMHKSTRGVDGVHCDSLTISGATSHIFNVVPGISKFYAGTGQTNITNAGRRLRIRLKFVGTGTQRSIIRAVLIPLV